MLVKHNAHMSSYTFDTPFRIANSGAIWDMVFSPVAFIMSCSNSGLGAVKYLAVSHFASVILFFFSIAPFEFTSHKQIGSKLDN